MSTEGTGFPVQIVSGHSSGNYPAPGQDSGGDDTYLACPVCGHLFEVGTPGMVQVRLLLTDLVSLSGRLTKHPLLISSVAAVPEPTPVVVHPRCADILSQARILMSQDGLDLRTAVRAAGITLGYWVRSDPPEEGGAAAAEPSG